MKGFCCLVLCALASFFVFDTQGAATLTNRHVRAVVLPVQGVAQGADGQICALLKDVGLVTAGDNVVMPGQSGPRKARILEITADGVVAELELPPPVKKPPAPPPRPVGPRDPFWPVGWTPR